MSPPQSFTIRKGSSSLAMVHFVLIRPGSTDYDVQARIQGSLDIPLNERGRMELAAALAPLALAFWAVRRRRHNG